MVSVDRARNIAARWAPLLPQESEVARLARGEVVSDAPLLERQLEACYQDHRNDSPWNDLVDLVALIDWSRLAARSLSTEETRTDG